MQQKADLFFKDVDAKKIPSVLLLRGEDPYLSRELKEQLKKMGFELHEVHMDKGGPSAEIEDKSMGGSLFFNAAILWIKKVSAPSSWTKAATLRWSQMAARADGQNLIIILQVPQEKKINWKVLGSFHEVDFDSLDMGPWLQRMNKARKGPLDVARMKFLLEQAEDLMTLENWVELWSLGGDVWAQKTLGWGADKGAEKNKIDKGQNPAFAWVDAVLKADRKRATFLLSHLLSEGEEPLVLLALLSKSVRILASVEGGENPVGQPDFLVSKMRSLFAQQKSKHPRRGHELLRKCSAIDVQLKSTPVNAEVALANL